MKEKQSSLATFFKIDVAIETVLKYISYIAGAITFLIALFVTINIVTTKVFTWSIPGVTEWVTYLFIGMIYFSIGYVRLSMGLVSVDVISNHLPSAVNDAVTVLSDIAGAVCYGMVARYAWPLMLSNLQLHVYSSTGTGKFLIWPFNAIIMVFAGIFAFTMLWHILRLFVYKMHGRRPGSLEELERRQWKKREEDAA